MNKDYENNVVVGEDGSETYKAIDGSVHKLVRSAAQGGQPDNCHLCSFVGDTKVISLTKDCWKIGEVCINQPTKVHFVKI